MKDIYTMTKNDWHNYRRANRHVDIPLFEEVEEGYVIYVLAGTFRAYNIQKDWIAFEEESYDE